MTYHAPANRVLRIGTSGHLDDALHAALEARTGNYCTESGRTATSGFRRRSVRTARCNSLFQFLAVRPDVIVADSSGPSALQAIAYRSTYRKSRLLLWVASEERVRSFRWISSRNIDGVLAPASVARSITGPGMPFPQIFPMPESTDVDEFTLCPAARADGDTHTLVYCGDLTPEAGILEFLLCASLWAERNPSRRMEILWIGEGDLLGVMKAQPTPDNLTQRFSGQISRTKLADVFARAGFLVVPTVRDTQKAPVAEALASGVLVIGSTRDSVVQKIVRHGESGWLFDPYSPADLPRVLDLALDTPSHALNQMRSSARAAIVSMSRHSFGECLDYAISTVLRERNALSDRSAITAS